MKLTKYYKVAGHTFAVCLPKDSSLWRGMAPYSGFEVDAAPGATGSNNKTTTGSSESTGGKASGNTSPMEVIFSLELAGWPGGGEALPCLPELETVYDAPTEDGETVIKLYSSRDGSIKMVGMARDHRCPICAKLLCDKEFKTGRLYLCSKSLNDANFAVSNSAMLLYAFTTASLNTLEMHASVILNSGKAFLFLGKSGTGKSTHSSLWLRHIEGSELMNDDNPIVKILPDGKVMAYGSPWSGKTPCYKNIEAPVGAFVQIKQYPENEIRKMSLLEAYATLYSSASGFKADKAMADGLHDSMEKVVTGIPFYELSCRPDEEAATLCHSTICK